MRFATLLLVSLLLASCGYHFPGTSGTLPGGVEQLSLALFANKTVEPRLEQTLFAEMSSALSRNSSIHLVKSESNADGVLNGTIVSYANRASAYDSSDDVSEYRATLVVQAVLKRIDSDEVLWQGRLSRSSDYSVEDDKMMQEDLEDDAIEELCERLADDLLSRLTDNF